MWLQCCLLTLWGALPGVVNGVASLHDATKGSKAVSQEWRSNDALREYLGGGGVDETCITVQSSTHDFHVSKRLKH